MFASAAYRPLWPVIVFLPWFIIGVAYLVKALSEKMSRSLSAARTAKSVRWDPAADWRALRTAVVSRSNRMRAWRFRSTVSAARAARASRPSERRRSRPVRRPFANSPHG